MSLNTCFINVILETDPDGKLFAELVGMCDLIPAYMISDLSEVLEMISKNPQVTLGDARPTKVLYYLQVGGHVSSSCVTLIGLLFIHKNLDYQL